MKNVVLILITIVLLSAEGNCQWYNKKYGVKDLSQLTQEQLNHRLKVDKTVLACDPAIFIVGTGSIIAGIHLINKGNSEPINPCGFFKVPRRQGIIFLSSGIALDICGLLLIPLSLSEMNQIKKALGIQEIKLALVDCFTNDMFNYSNGLPVPGISLIIGF